MLAFNKPWESYEKFLVIKKPQKEHHLISKTFRLYKGLYNFHRQFLIL